MRLQLRAASGRRRSARAGECDVDGNVDVIVGVGAPVIVAALVNGNGVVDVIHAVDDEGRRAP